MRFQKQYVSFHIFFFNKVTELADSTKKPLLMLKENLATGLGSLLCFVTSFKRAKENEGCHRLI